MADRVTRQDRTSSHMSSLHSLELENAAPSDSTGAKDGRRQSAGSSAGSSSAAAETRFPHPQNS